MNQLSNFLEESYRQSHRGRNDKLGSGDLRFRASTEMGCSDRKVQVMCRGDQITCTTITTRLGT